MRISDIMPFRKIKVKYKFKKVLGYQNGAIYYLFGLTKIERERYLDVVWLN